MVDEPVDHGGGDDVIAEDLAPTPEDLVRGDDQAGPLVAGADELEEQVRGLGFEGDVADLVDLCRTWDYADRRPRLGRRSLRRVGSARS